MRPGISTLRCGQLCRRAAFSLIEIMVTVAMLSFIVLGLLAMFTQTKRAFTGSLVQSSVLESGRAVMELITRDLEKMSPSHAPNLRPNYLTTNFFAELAENFGTPLRQGLPGTTGTAPGTRQNRINFVQRFFVLSQENNQWSGTGYQVLADDSNGGVGTLYRVSAQTANRASVGLLSSNFVHAFGPDRRLTNLDRIADGVVHLRFRAFATNGFPVIPGGFMVSPDVNAPRGGVTNSFCRENIQWPGYHDYYFVSNAVPAYLELELGILEPKSLERYQSMRGNPVAQLDYLSNRVAQVHLFRQRIPIRNVDYHAYQ